jgi:hypothetical protein
MPYQYVRERDSGRFEVVWPEPAGESGILNIGMTETLDGIRESVVMKSAPPWSGGFWVLSTRE